jgi:hypothetical protein
MEISFYQMSSMGRHFDAKVILKVRSASVNKKRGRGKGEEHMMRL